MFTPLRTAIRLGAPVLLILSSISPLLRAEATPSPALLITSQGDNALVIVDPKDGHTVASVPVGGGPHEIAVSPDGKLAAVSNFGRGNSISIVDLQAQKESDRYEFTFPARPNSIVFADGKFFVTAEDADLILGYNPATKKVDTMIGLGQLTSHVMLYNPDDKSFIVASRNSATVSFVERFPIEYRGNTRPNWKVTPVPAVHFNEAMDLSPDRKELWVSEFRGGKVAVLDVATRKVTATFEVPNLESDRLKFTPDGKLVFLSDITTGNLVIYDVATHKEVRRVKLGKGLEGMQITPDGSTAYAVAPAENEVLVVNLKTFEVTGHISVKSPLGVVWVP